MSDPSLYQYESPLKGWERLDPLPKYVQSFQVYCVKLTVFSDKAEDGKSFINPPAAKKSDAYDAFVSPISNDRRGGFE